MTAHPIIVRPVRAIKRRTNSMDVCRANIYKLIKDVFDQLPDEFLPKELYL